MNQSNSALFGDDDVRAFQMLLARLLLLCATFHVQTFCHHVLHQARVLSSELARLARLVVHPVPHRYGRGS